MTMQHRGELHGHISPEAKLSEEQVEEGRLHRHRLEDEHGRTVFTTWGHNSHSHTHRLPGGAYSKPRTRLYPPEPEPRRTLDDRE